MAINFKGGLYSSFGDYLLKYKNRKESFHKVVYSVDGKLKAYEYYGKYSYLEQNKIADGKLSSW